MADDGLVTETRTEVEVCGEDLNENRAELASAGTDSMAGGAVPGGEDLGRDYVGSCIGA